MSTKIIDSHLHVWADSKEAVSFPYAENQSPPEQLADRASKSALLQNMDKAGVTGSLIVQPINHKFDHTYVLSAINENKRFKAMMLHNPNHSSNEAVSQLEDLALKGFVGVRFNPYLWPEKEDGSGWEPMSKGAGLSVYKRCAELQVRGKLWKICQCFIFYFRTSIDVRLMILFFNSFLERCQWG